MSILATVLKMVGQHGRSQTSHKWIYMYEIEFVGRSNYTLINVYIYIFFI